MADNLRGRGQASFVDVRPAEPVFDAGVSSSRLVSTTGPFSVMATVCSEWAVRELSLIHIPGIRDRPRFEREGQAGAQLQAAARLALVGDVQLLVHGAADAVAAELGVDPVSYTHL